MRQCAADLCCTNPAARRSCHPPARQPACAPCRLFPPATPASSKHRPTLPTAPTSHRIGSHPLPAHPAPPPYVPATQPTLPTHPPVHAVLGKHGAIKCHHHPRRRLAASSAAASAAAAAARVAQPLEYACDGGSGQARAARAHQPAHLLHLQPARQAGLRHAKCLPCIVVRSALRSACQLHAPPGAPRSTYRLSLLLRGAPNFQSSLQHCCHSRQVGTAILIHSCHISSGQGAVAS